MANYNVGNIEIGILSDSTKALQSLDKVISKLQEFGKIDKNVQTVFQRINNLSNGLKKMNELDTSKLTTKIKDVAGATVEMTKKFNEIDQPNFEATAKSLNKLGNALRQFNNLKDFDFRKMYNSFDSMNRILTPFLEKLQSSELALASLSNILNKFKPFVSNVKQANVELKKMKQNTASTQNAFESFNTTLNKVFNISYVYFLYNYTKRFTSLIGKSITLASDYAEILNKYQMSFGDLTEENLALTEKLADAFGISSNTLMDYTATFNNMLNGLKGLDVGTSAKLSQTLTQMAVDYSSLFNVSIDSSMKAFQSAIAGNIRSLRDISGYDVSETTIYSIYQQMGGTKSMRQLNQLEKRLLRIVAIQKQMESTGALGDYGRTIDTVSNQVKILKEQLIEMGKWIGMNLLVYIKPLIIYANALVMTITRFAKELAKAKEEADGIDYKKEFAGFSGGVDDVTESTEALAESLTTLPLDKLNVLSNSSSTTSSPTDGLSVEGRILDSLKEYKYNLDQISSTAKTISEKMYNWLKDGDRLGKIIKTVTGSLATIVGFKLFSKVKELITAFSSLKGALSGSNTLIKLFTVAPTSLKVIGVVVALLITMFAKSKDFRKGLFDLIKSVGKIFQTIFKAFPVFKLLGKIFNVGLEFIKGVGDVIGNVFGIVADIIDFVLAFFKTSEKESPIDKLDKKLGVIDKIKSAFQFLSNSLKVIRKLIQDATKNIDKTKTKIIVTFTTLGKNIKDTFSSLWTNITDGFKNVINFFIRGINVIIDGLNKVHFETPDWIPGVGGKSFGFNIKRLEELQTSYSAKSIPKMANGGVVTSPTMALIGEYQNAKSNPEIVTPQNILRETMMETMVTFVNAILQGNNDVVKAIEGKDMSVYVNGRKVSEAIYNDLNSVATRKGKVLFTTRN